MARLSGVKKIFFIWLAWGVILFVFQAFVLARFQLERPDTARSWTVQETARGAQNDQPYLMDPFLNEHTAWDAEFYLGIADKGYDNDLIRTIPGPGPGGRISLSYAFFPLYAYLMRGLEALILPPGIFGLGRLATLTLSGVIISLLGTLGAMLALYDLTRVELGERGGVRAAFYLLIFPTGFFLGQVYSEGLFVGLAFGTLALVRRKKLLWAGLLAALAVWTRAVGVALVLPLCLAVMDQVRAREKWNHLALGGLGMVMPLLSLGAWWWSDLRPRFAFVEANFFHRGFLLIEQSLGDWQLFWEGVQHGANSQAAVYNALEIILAALALAACLGLMRRMPGVALFSLAVFVICFLSGSGQSMSRYVLGIPAVFIGLSKLGENEAFDRGWTLASVLWMAALTTLFSFDLWVA
jgi:hypothetical protein